MKNQNIFLISSHCLDMAAPAVEGAAVAALRSVMARVRYAAERSGREPELIRVVAVSKTKPVSLIRQVYDAGHRCFGENYVHEILDKAPQLPEDVEWHFVGHLQSNKVKSLLSGVPNLSMVEGVHNEKHEHSQTHFSLDLPRLSSSFIDLLSSHLADGGFLQMRPGIAASGGNGLHMARIGGLTEEGLPAAGRDLRCSPWFLLSFEFQREKPWMTHLAFVACLSLSAKAEETQVPFLLDFQVEESTFVFEAKAIKRMELPVLSTLEWKMNPVTPISFLDYIIRRLGLKDHLCWEFLKRCENIILSLISDSRFMSFLPSIVATATMLHVVDSIEPCLQVEYQNQLLGILGIDKDKAEDCCKLISELASANVGQSKKRKFGVVVVPGSPNGVMDVSFSSDSSNDSWAVASSVSSSPEPLSKKMRAHTTSADFITIPR